MPRFSKWLINAEPSAPVDRVARRAIAARLRAVAWYFQAAARDHKAEDIHQLRIWTRRASAALKLFAPAIGEPPAKRLKRTLRELRRAAGRVRDCDVHLQSLRDSNPPPQLVRKLKKHRRRARKELKALFRWYARKERFSRQVAAVQTVIAWPKRHSSRTAPSFAAWCREQLAPLAQEFFVLATVESGGDAQLHELRLAGKRLRYALELSAAAVPPRTFRRLYDELSGLQDRLGAICDSQSAIKRIHDWKSSANKRKQREQFEALLAREERRLAMLRRQFQRWWSPARCARSRQRWQQVIPF
jgi:CHAD domain-containing protein